MIFASGTPVSNSMTEMFTLQRYLQLAKLREKKLQMFDAWAGNFGEKVTAMELAPDGSGYRQKERFAKFFNLPELLTMFREFADIQTAEMLKLPVPNCDFETITSPPSDELLELVTELVKRSEAIRNGRTDPRIDNMLKITNDGRLAALDIRLINPGAPDLPDSKLNTAAGKIVEIWEETKPDKLTQLVFSDLSTPTGKGFNVYDDLRPS